MSYDGFIPFVTKHNKEFKSFLERTDQTLSLRKDYLDWFKDYGFSIYPESDEEVKNKEFIWELVLLVEKDNKKEYYRLEYFKDSYNALPDFSDFIPVKVTKTTKTVTVTEYLV